MIVYEGPNEVGTPTSAAGYDTFAAAIDADSAGDLHLLGPVRAGVDGAALQAYLPERQLPAGR